MSEMLQKLTFVSLFHVGSVSLVYIQR